MPVMINSRHKSRKTSLDSANSSIPSKATPTAPMPVQTAYAVPTGMVFIAIESNHRLTPMEIAVKMLGTSLLKPSVYFRPIAQPISNNPAIPRYTHAISNSCWPNAAQAPESRAKTASAAGADDAGFCPVIRLPSVTTKGYQSEDFE